MLKWLGIGSSFVVTRNAGGVRSVSLTGVLGDPTGASAAEGAALLDAATADLVAFMERW